MFDFGEYTQGVYDEMDRILSDDPEIAMEKESTLI
jgi:hypothetical protein